jgi:DNA-binding GntR family transcriptional regulator
MFRVRWQGYSIFGAGSQYSSDNDFQFSLDIVYAMYTIQIKYLVEIILVKQEIYDLLRRNILTMVLEPGSSLDEKRLADQFSISRTPLREILRKLQGDGYVEIFSNRGAYVSSMNHKALRDFFNTAPMIYSAIGQLAADNATSVQIDTIKIIQRKFVESVINDKNDDRIYYNQQFHAVMGEMADNPYLLPSYNRLLIDHARISQTFYRPKNSIMIDRVNEAVRHHDEIITALEMGNREVISNLVSEHWDLSRDLIEHFIKPAPLNFELNEKR